MMGERRDDKKKTTTRISGRERIDDHVHGEGGEKGRRKKDNDKDNDTGWEQAAAYGGEAQSGWIFTWLGVGWGGRDRAFCFEAETNHRNNRWGGSLLRLDALGGGEDDACKEGEGGILLCGH